MAKLFDRVKMTIASTGTGTLTLGSAVSGYLSFSGAGVANGDTVSYVIEDTGGAWERGTCVYTSTGTSIARTVIASSNSNTAINATTNAIIFITAFTADICNPANNLSEIASATTARTNLGLGSAATLSSSAILQASNNLSDLTTPATARTNLGLGSAATLTAGTGANNLVQLTSGSALPAVSATNLTSIPVANASGTLAVGNGGTGTTNLTSGCVFVGNGANSVTQTTLYVNSTGNIGANVSASTAYGFKLSTNISGGAGNAWGQLIDGTIQSTVTSAYYGFESYPATAAATFTLANLTHFYAGWFSQGAGSTVTSQYGFYASSYINKATNNYGFYGDIASAANTYNIYINGTAQNLFSGDVLVFGAGKIGYTTGSGGTVTQATSRTTGVTLNKTNGAITLFTAAGSTSATTFTVTNSTVAATDVIKVNQKSGSNLYVIMVTAVAAGSFNITFYTTGGTTSEAPVFNFAVIKAVTA